MRALLADGLRWSGRFDVVAQAADGNQALEALARHQTELALIDLGMPVAGGLDVIDQVKVISPDIRVVVVSGYPREGLEELVVSKGAAAYVRKQLSISKLI